MLYNLSLIYASGACLTGAILNALVGPKLLKAKVILSLAWPVTLPFILGKGALPFSEEWEGGPKKEKENEEYEASSSLVPPSKRRNRYPPGLNPNLDYE